MKIEAVDNPDFSEISHLVERSIQEEFRFLKKLVEEWESGINRFDKPNERLYKVTVNNLIIGIGGINEDPYKDSTTIGRIRHLYIDPEHRRRGIGKKLIQTILEDFKHAYQVVTVRTDSEKASGFYEAIGFMKVYGSKTDTHRLNVTISV